MKLTRNLLLATIIFSLGGCASTIIESTTDVVVAVAKIPYKLGRAVIDATTDTEED